MQRFIIGLVTGVAVTFCLFLLMSYLIKAGYEGELAKPKDFKKVDIVMLEQDDQLNVRPRKPPKKPPEQKPPPPQAQKIAQTSKPTLKRLQIEIEKPSFGSVGTFIGEQGDIGSDGEAIPIMTTEPRYPEEAAQAGTEGWVKFRFTVSADGSPKDIELIDSKPRFVFNREAKRAIRNWRFQPKKVDGKPVDQKGMEYTMVFKLETETADN